MLGPEIIKIKYDTLQEKNTNLKQKDNMKFSFNLNFQWQYNTFLDVQDQKQIH